MQHNIRNNDMVSRLGGEEFGIYIDTKDNAVCHQILQTILEKIKQMSFDTDQGQLNNVTVSIGATMFKKGLHAIDTTYFDIAMKQADQALYEVKRSGKASINWFSPSNALKKDGLVTDFNS